MAVKLPHCRNKNTAIKSKHMGFDIGKHMIYHDAVTGTGNIMVSISTNTHKEKLPIQNFTEISLQIVADFSCLFSRCSLFYIHFYTCELL